MANSNCTSRHRRKHFVVYGLFDPRTNALRYIGKSEHGVARLQQHLYQASTGELTRKARWVRGLMAAGLTPEFRVLEECPDSMSLLAAEEKWVRQGRANGERLTNLTDGGIGCVGYQPTAATRRKIAESHARSLPRQRHLCELSERCQKPVADQYGTRYPSVKAAALAIGVSSQLITNILAGRALTARGFSFRRADNDRATWTNLEEWSAWISARREAARLSSSERARATNFGGRNTPEAIARGAAACRKAVTDQRGTTYHSVQAAAAAIGAHPSSVSDVLRKRSASVKGYTFRYAERVA